MSAVAPDAVVGSVLGGAVGDALGLPYEGRSPGRAARLLGPPDRHRCGRSEGGDRRPLGSATIAPEIASAQADGLELDGTTPRTSGMTDRSTSCRWGGLIYDPSLPLARGKVGAGEVIVEGPPLPEGATVRVLPPEAAETFEVGAEEEAALLDAMGQADRGETVDGVELLRQLRPPG